MTTDETPPMDAQPGGEANPSDPTSGARPRAPEGKSALARVSAGALQGAVELLAALPAEDVWLEGLESARTRRAYRNDVADFVASLGVRSSEELYATTPAAIIAWRRQLEASKADGGRGLKKSTVLRKLSALSSLFEHLVEQHLSDINPVKQVKRPKRRDKDERGRRKGVTRSFSQEEARMLLDAPSTETIVGLRDRAILSCGLQAGLRRSEIAHLTVGSVAHHSGLPCLEYTKKGDSTQRVPLNPQTHKRILDYLEKAGHGNDTDGPLFRALRGNQHVEAAVVRHMAPDMIDRVVRKWVSKKLGHTRGFSAHSMRATFITRALENGCALERVQRDVGHAHPSTTQMYDHRGDNAEEAATFFANY